MYVDTMINFLSTQGLDFALKLLGALAAWIIGRWIIGMVVRAFNAVVARGHKIDATLAKYLSSIISVVLTVLLVMSILDIFGVRTTSFAAMLAGAGLAIGAAWSGLLSHFAAGVFMQVLRPFKVGDFVQAGGVTGTVHEVGLFGTTIITPDNVMTIVGNNKVFSESIQNFTTLPFRRVDCVAKVANSVDPLDAIARLKASIVQIPNVATSPAPDIEITGFTPEGPAGTEPNIPPGYKDRDYQKAKYTKKEDIENNKFNETHRKIKKQPWELERVNLAVLLDGKWERLGIKADQSGYERKYMGVSDEELLKVTDVLKKSIGFDIARGDQISVKHLQIDRSKQFEAEDEELRAQIARRKLLIGILITLIALAIAYVAYIFIKREKV